MKKYPHELTARDVVSWAPDHKDDMHVLIIAPSKSSNPISQVAMWGVPLHNTGRAGPPQVHEWVFAVGEQVEVEDHAGELQPGDVGVLVDAARRFIESGCVHSGEGWTWTDLQAVVDRLAPPMPPTMQEVLHALDNAEPKLRNMMSDTDRRFGPLLDLLDRARRTGLLDEGA